MAGENFPIIPGAPQSNASMEFAALQRWNNGITGPPSVWTPEEIEAIAAQEAKSPSAPSYAQLEAVAAEQGYAFSRYAQGSTEQSITPDLARQQTTEQLQPVTERSRFDAPTNHAPTRLAEQFADDQPEPELSKLSREEMRALIDEEAARHKARPKNKLGRKIVALTISALGLLGGAFMGNENRNVTISDQEIEKSEEDFLGRNESVVSLDKPVYGQIEAEISDGSRVGLVLEQCPVQVFSHDGKLGQRKNGCEIVPAEVTDGAWLILEPGDYYQR